MSAISDLINSCEESSQEYRLEHLLNTTRNANDEYSLMLRDIDQLRAAAAERDIDIVTIAAVLFGDDNTAGKGTREICAAIRAQAAQLAQARKAWNALCEALDELYISGTVDGLGRVADARAMWPESV